MPAKLLVAHQQSRQRSIGAGRVIYTKYKTIKYVKDKRHKVLFAVFTLLLKILYAYIQQILHEVNSDIFQAVFYLLLHVLLSKI